VRLPPPAPPVRSRPSEQGRGAKPEPATASRLPADTVAQRDAKAPRAARAYGGSGWWLHCYRGGCCCYQHNRVLAVVKQDDNIDHEPLLRQINWQFPESQFQSWGVKPRAEEPIHIRVVPL
jgi:hypothetical protein